MNLLPFLSRLWPRTLWQGALALALLAVAGGLVWKFWPADTTSAYITQEVSRGDITQSIAASGTLNPVTVVSVGTQVSGIVKNIYVDFNDHVEKNQLLAELDTKVLEGTLTQSKATLASARASLKLAEANYRRNKELFAQQFIARADLDSSEQALSAAKAQVQSAGAAVEKDTTNLSYATIRSPVAGVVVSRSVDVGQTVAASFSTPTLFSIAEDLRKMQINTNISEADVGNVSTTMPVTFTVDAFPGRTFAAKVRQIRLNPTTVQNVVTYNVVLDVDNTDMTLLPGMTAFVTLTIAESKNVLRVPNGALTYHPEAATRKATRQERKQAAETSTTTVFVLKDDAPVAVPVTPGIADDRFTAVTSAGLKEGDVVITGKTGATGNSLSGKKSAGPAGGPPRMM